jgi:hypothetical protein
MPSPSGVFTGTGRLNSSIRALIARQSLAKTADLAVELLLGFRMQPAVGQLLLGLGDSNLTLHMRVFVLHGSSFRDDSMVRTMMSRRWGLVFLALGLAGISA